MGCDIHCVIEFKREDTNYWDSFGFNAITPGRNYEWFGDLAGVRGEPKGGECIGTPGLPADTSFATKCETTVYVDENNRAYVEGWVNSKTSTWVDWSKDMQNKPNRVTHPDFHSHGWVDIKRWKKSVRGWNNLQIKCMTAIMDTLKKNNCEVRVVFWFDN